MTRLALDLVRFLALQRDNAVREIQFALGAVRVDFIRRLQLLRHHGSGPLYLILLLRWVPCREDHSLEHLL